VLEGHLAKQGGDEPWLVGGKMSYADLSFVPWTHFATVMLGGKGQDYDLSKYPHVKKWFDSMMARSIVKKAMDDAMQH